MSVVPDGAHSGPRDVLRAAVDEPGEPGVGTAPRGPAIDRSTTGPRAKRRSSWGGDDGTADDDADDTGTEWPIAGSSPPESIGEVEDVTSDGGTHRDFGPAGTVQPPGRAPGAGERCAGDAVTGVGGSATGCETTTGPSEPTAAVDVTDVETGAGRAGGRGGRTATPAGRISIGRPAARRRSGVVSGPGSTSRARGRCGNADRRIERISGTPPSGVPALSPSAGNRTGADSPCVAEGDAATVRTAANAAGPWTSAADRDGEDQLLRSSDAPGGFGRRGAETGCTTSINGCDSGLTGCATSETGCATGRTGCDTPSYGCAGGETDCATYGTGWPAGGRRAGRAAARAPSPRRVADAASRAAAVEAAERLAAQPSSAS